MVTAASARISPTIRRAEIADAEQLTRYFNALQAEKLDVIRRRPSVTVADETALIEKAEKDDRAYILLAINDNEIVSMVDCWGSAEAWNSHVLALGMSVAKSARRQGVGQLLISKALDTARTIPGIRRVELEVVAWNEPAVALYRKTGFTEEGRKIGAVNLRGQPEDMVIFAKVW